MEGHSVSLGEIRAKFCSDSPEVLQVHIVSVKLSDKRISPKNLAHQFQLILA